MAGETGTNFMAHENHFITPNPIRWKGENWASSHYIAFNNLALYCIAFKVFSFNRLVTRNVLEQGVFLEIRALR